MAMPEAQAHHRYLSGLLGEGYLLRGREKHVGGREGSNAREAELSSVSGVPVLPHSYLH